MFSLIRNLSETVVLPIAGIVLTFVATIELIQLIIDRNNLQEVDTWIFFKWIFKTAAAILILSNTFNIVMAVFDVAQHVYMGISWIAGGKTFGYAPMRITRIIKENSAPIQAGIKAFAGSRNTISGKHQ